MADGKVAANLSLGRSQGDVKAKLARLEASYRELSTRLKRLERRTEQAEKVLSAPWWTPVITGLGLFGLGAAFSAMVF